MISQLPSIAERQPCGHASCQAIGAREGFAQSLSQLGLRSSNCASSCRWRPRWCVSHSNVLAETIAKVLCSDLRFAKTPCDKSDAREYSIITQSELRAGLTSASKAEDSFACKLSELCTLRCQQPAVWKTISTRTHPGPSSEARCKRCFRDVRQQRRRAPAAGLGWRAWA